MNKKIVCKARNNKVTLWRDREYLLQCDIEEGFSIAEVEQSDIDGCYYLASFAPQKTESEKQKEAAQDELQTVDAQLKEQDELSIRNICSMLINPKDIFAINKLKEREKIKEQLRARRKELEKIISDASV